MMLSIRLKKYKYLFLEITLVLALILINTSLSTKEEIKRSNLIINIYEETGANTYKSSTEYNNRRITSDKNLSVNELPIPDPNTPVIINPL